MPIFNFIISFFKRLRAEARPNPARDWMVLLSFSAIVLVCIIVWNLWAFNTVTRGGTIGASATTTAPAFSRATLDAIHAVFTDRAEEEAKYRTGTYRYADPSQ